jgi:hypothetical protein
MWMMAAALIALVVIAGCSSPEAQRVRAGGPGADVGNRSADVEIHEGAQPYYKTPVLVKDIERGTQGQQPSTLPR